MKRDKRDEVKNPPWCKGNDIMTNNNRAMMLAEIKFKVQDKR